MKAKRLRRTFIFCASAIVLVLAVHFVSLHFARDKVWVYVAEISQQLGILREISTPNGTERIRVFEMRVSSGDIFTANLLLRSQEDDSLESHAEILCNENVLNLATLPVYRRFGYWRTHRYYLIMTSEGKYGISLQKPRDNRISREFVDFVCRNKFSIDTELYEQLFWTRYTDQAKSVFMGQRMGGGRMLLLVADQHSSRYAQLYLRFEKMGDGGR